MRYIVSQRFSLLEFLGMPYIISFYRPWWISGKYPSRILKSNAESLAFLSPLPPALTPSSCAAKLARFACRVAEHEADRGSAHVGIGEAAEDEMHGWYLLHGLSAGLSKGGSVVYPLRKLNQPRHRCCKRRFPGHCKSIQPKIMWDQDARVYFAVKPTLVLVRCK